MAREPEEPDTRPGAVDDLTRGVDSVLGREVAMLTLPATRGAALAARVEQVRRLAGLHHPNLVEIYDVDGMAEDTESTLVLQHVDGHSLDAVVGTAPWPAVAVAHVGSQVAAALAHAHARGVVHGGLGPASIVVDDSLHAWLTGFTAALLPGPRRTRPGEDVVPPTPGDDVAALAAVLRALLPGSGPVPEDLDAALDAMVTDGADADAAAGTLARVAESCAHDGPAPGMVPMAVYSAPAATPAPSAPVPFAPTTPSVPTPSVPTPSVPTPHVPEPRAGMRRRMRVAALGAAATAVAAAAALVLWGPLSFSSPLPASEVTGAPPGVAAPPAPGPPAVDGGTVGVSPPATERESEPGSGATDSGATRSQDPTRDESPLADTPAPDGAPGPPAVGPLPPGGPIPPTASTPPTGPPPTEPSPTPPSPTPPSPTPPLDPSPAPPLDPSPAPPSPTPPSPTEPLDPSPTDQNGPTPPAGPSPAPGASPSLLAAPGA